jgi:hypothetical protein
LEDQARSVARFDDIAWVCCPHWSSWSLPALWTSVPQDAFPFVVRCPWCLGACDVTDFAMRLGPPEGASEVQAVAAQALRVSRAVARVTPHLSALG